MSDIPRVVFPDYKRKLPVAMTTNPFNGSRRYHQPATQSGERGRADCDGPGPGGNNRPAIGRAIRCGKRRAQWPGHKGERAGGGCALNEATDPDYLEKRLGRPASKGCVRIPAAMNRFLDRHGVLDADYERAAKDDPRFEAVLLRERTPTPLAGNALVIVDSADTPAARLNAPDDAADATSAAAGQTAPQL
jgi:hypothetical protein